LRDGPLIMHTFRKDPDTIATLSQKQSGVIKL